MTTIWITLLFVLTLFSSALSAQQPSVATTSLNDEQVLGRRVFRQRCAVCHLPPVPGARVYGPSLYKDLVIGNDDTIREFIMNGSKGKMPGFKYGLDRTEIDAIVEFLKTVEKAKPVKPGNSEGTVVND